MSTEVQDAVQVVALCGRSAYLLGDLTVKAFLMSLKIMEAIYCARWKGKVGFNRMLRIKGEENGLMFINIGIEPNNKENKKIFNDILKELKAHKIMYTVMPDLCAGDGSTQIVISNLDAGKFVAMALDHKNGKHGDIQLAEITQYDYTMTGQRGDGTLTPEAQSLVNSAKTLLNRTKNQFQKRFEKLIHKIKKFFGLANEHEFQPPVLAQGKYELQKSVSPGNNKDFHKLIANKKYLEEKRAQITGPSNLLTDKQAEQACAIHDNIAVYGQAGYAWLNLHPILSGDIEGAKYYLVPLPDGINAVVIPEKYYREPLPGDFSGALSTPGCLVLKSKNYMTVNLETKKISVTGGEKVIGEARKMGVEEYGRQLQNLQKNLQKNQKEVLELADEIKQAFSSRKPR